MPTLSDETLKISDLFEGEVLRAIDQFSRVLKNETKLAEEVELKNWNPVTEGSDGRVTGKPGGSLGASWQWKPGWHSAPPHQSCQVALLNPHHHSSHLDARNPPPWADPVGMHAAGSLLHHLPALPAPTLLFKSNLGPEAPCLELATNAMQSGSQVLQLFRTQRPFPLQALNSRSSAQSYKDKTIWYQPADAEGLNSLRTNLQDHCSTHRHLPPPVSRSPKSAKIKVDEDHHDLTSKNGEKSFGLTPDCCWAVVASPSCLLSVNFSFPGVVNVLPPLSFFPFNSVVSSVSPTAIFWTTFSFCSFKGAGCVASSSFSFSSFLELLDHVFSSFPPTVVVVVVPVLDLFVQSFWLLALCWSRGGWLLRMKESRSQL